MNVSAKGSYLKRLISIFTILAFLAASSPVQTFTQFDRALTILTAEGMLKIKGGCTPDDKATWERFGVQCDKCDGQNVSKGTGAQSTQSKCVCVSNEWDETV